MIKKANRTLRNGARVVKRDSMGCVLVCSGAVRDNGVKPKSTLFPLERKR
jgi:hypothetical protein